MAPNMLYVICLPTTYSRCLQVVNYTCRKQQKSYDALFLGEGIPALTIKELHSYNVNDQISGYDG